MNLLSLHFATKELDWWPCKGHQHLVNTKSPPSNVLCKFDNKNASTGSEDIAPENYLFQFLRGTDLEK